MNILLISPVKNSENRELKKVLVAPLALFILKGLTPSEHKVKIVWWEVEDLNFEEECDLVGISCMTANASRAYEIAEEFRKRGKTVVMGGIHPTIMPEEALQHADCVVIGEAEGVWVGLINDFQRGELKKIYKDPSPDLTKYIPIDFNDMVKKGFSNFTPIWTTRGCPYNCDFCSVSNIYGRKIRHVPIANVVQEIINSKAKNFIFLDDNIIGDSIYAKELFRALIPLKIKWYGDASIFLVEDPGLLQLAKESGCIALFVGLESISDYQLKILPKQYNNTEQLEEALRKIKKAGILVYAGIVFGFDTDTKEIFAKTVKFLQKNGICSAAFHILTPYPGTKYFADMKKDDRLLTENWKFYDHVTAVFKPQNMTPYELQYGTVQANQQLYSYISIAKRFFNNLSHPLVFLAVNFFYRKHLKKEKQRIQDLKYLNKIL